MPNPQPVPGKCNAKRKDGTFCANRPLWKDGAGGGRCKHHGGANTGPRTQAGKERQLKAALVHGLYAKRLYASFASDEDKKLFKYADRSTDLSYEIALYRTKIAQFQTMIGRGETAIQKGVRADGTIETILVHDLLDRATELLNRMTKNQQTMHPNAGRTGHLSINIMLDPKSVLEANADLPNLEAGVAMPKTESVLGESSDEPSEEESPLARFEE